jgi:cell division protein ZapE
LLDLESLIAALPARPDAAELMAEFVPPARFAEKRFDGYDPRHPSQASAVSRLRSVVGELRAESGGGFLRRARSAFRAPAGGGGVYLDGGFGVGKTHLLAALWNESPVPKAYLSFDSLTHVSGYMGDPEFRELFLSRRLVCVDEWELDDPGNLTLSLAVLRELLRAGVRVVATSNTLPLDLGEGRFSQKDFRSEIAEMAGAFEVLTLRGDDYRHRHFELNPGREYFVSPEDLVGGARAVGDLALLLSLGELLRALGRVHPLRYADLIRATSEVFLSDVGPIRDLADALRFVHFIDRLYNSATPLTASSDHTLGELFPPAFLAGPYGKKCSRCLSRLEEMLGENVTC